MAEFWNTLTTLIQQYTIADTANVFVIVEGIATVVAAVGAIIAVIVTIKISKEQINLAKKQNDISDKQADIAIKQNHLALFNERHEIYEYFIAFFNIWEGFPALLDGNFEKKRLFDLLISSYCINAVELNDIYSTKIRLDDIESLQRFQFAYYKRNMLAFGKLNNYFDFSQDQSNYIKQLNGAMNLLLISIFSFISGDQSTLNLINSFAVSLSAIITNGSKELMGEIKRQIQVID